MFKNNILKNIGHKGHYGSSSIGLSKKHKSGGKMKIFGCPIFKNGSGIHIKEKNRGKFTASAKAAG